MTEEATSVAALNSMELFPNQNHVNTGTKHLRDQLIATNNPEAEESDWATEKSKGETQKCNFIMAIATVNAKIKAVTADPTNNVEAVRAATLPDKLFLDVENQGKWAQKYLTTRKHKTKYTSFTMASDPKIYQVTEYYKYLPKKIYVHSPHINKFYDDHIADHPTLNKNDIVVKH